MIYLRERRRRRLVRHNTPFVHLREQEGDYCVHSNERLFLRDFVSCIAGSSGGRLAQWLQPGSRVDPSKCQVLYSRDELRCGWPAIITVLTRDQYSDIVHVPNMKVDIKAIPIDKNELGDAVRKMRRVSQPDTLTFGGQPTPSLQFPYEPTVRDKMYFHSITVMKVSIDSVINNVMKQIVSNSLEIFFRMAVEV
ncbi:hypothetical protein WA026_014689 [Henosepilachna vigintioctopunctata]|uniref:Uncharacterized protein n=1 Tax=Henosepilachna vigintioctopunctata TaxID=420089 RepID=A0AAW1VE68_9CUCU